MRVLLVKTSSMGDVVHALPAASDMVRQIPGLELDWLVEAPFAAIPRMHAGVRRVIPMAWRKWRKRLGTPETWRAIGELRRGLRRERYDLVLDLQGLVKSALWGLQARGPLAGYDRHSAREALAALCYTRRSPVSRELHAIERCRRLAAAQLGYPMPACAPEFGIAAPTGQWRPGADHAVLIPCASKAVKMWPEANWIELGRRFARHGWLPVVLWGSEPERQTAQRIAAGCAGVVPPFLSVSDCAAVLGGAAAIVGLDTGFSHLGAALGRPTVGIYCDHEPGLTGITGGARVASIGGKGAPPSLAAVQALVEDQIASLNAAR
ncbi:MAG: lipopolysaccharide heptosyltransferase I [Burkholderiaceae bacterium]|nr:lipopolysaccharide heptosyltransferase I [Burkholderiaceae bacterium]